MLVDLLTFTRSAALGTHIVAGSIALLAGAIALLVSKGSMRHRRSGRFYTGAIIALLSTGAGLAIARIDPFVAINAIFALYLVATSWWTLRTPPPVAALLPLVALGCGLADIAFGWHALGQPRTRFAGYPAGGYFGFAAFAIAAALGDLIYSRRPRGRIAALGRHAWRMSVPLTMAAGSLFLGQQQVLPHVVRGSPLLTAISAAPLVPLIWWLARLGRAQFRLYRLQGEPA